MYAYNSVESEPEDSTFTEEERRAPLASMEDLSVLATPMMTPMSTPGASPRTRARWSHRSSTGSQLGEELEPLNNNNGLDKGPTTSTPVRSSQARPPPILDEGPIPRRFSSPARQMSLFRQSLVNSAGQPPPGPPRHSQPYPLARNGFAIDPILEEPHHEDPYSKPSLSKRGWRPSDARDKDDEERIGILKAEGEANSVPKQVQFITPRRPAAWNGGGGVKESERAPSPCPCHDTENPNSNIGYRIAAAEAILLDGDSPRDRFHHLADQN